MTTTGPFKPRVLLIEDEAFIRLTIRRSLQTIDIPEIREAVDGTQALAILHDGFDPNIIFCDVRMAPMDGFTFLRTIRADPNPELAALPVIVLTSSADVKVVRRFSDLGISSYLLKPVSRQQLFAHMTVAVRRAAAMRPP